MFCYDSQCWVLANTAVWHSSDGGEQWRKVDFGRGELQHLRPSRISLPLEQVSDRELSVFILGSAGKRRGNKESVLLRSDDSGQSWKSLTALPQGVGLRALFFVNSRLGWIGGEQGKLWRTADGGETWQPCHLPTSQRVKDMWFDQTGKGFVAVQNNKVDNWGDALFETRDGGRTWIKTLDGAKQINRFYGLGPGQVWFVGDVTGRGDNDLVGILQPARLRFGSAMIAFQGDFEIDTVKSKTVEPAADPAEEVTDAPSAPDAAPTGEGAANDRSPPRDAGGRSRSATTRADDSIPPWVYVAGGLVLAGAAVAAVRMGASRSRRGRRRTPRP